MFIYHQSTGRLVHMEQIVGIADSTGAGPDIHTKIATGYSGHGEGRNNPTMEAVRSVGPIPRGEYEISPPFDTQAHGPLVMHLSPVGHDALGRSGFLVHGDNVRHDASHGCIILPHAIRRMLSTCGETRLKVEI